MTAASAKRTDGN